MRGMKGSPYDGGHRTPLFLRWPAGGYAEGRDIDRLTANVDVLPTLIDLCGLEPPQDAAFSGTSLKPLLEGADWPDRTVVTDSQRVDHPVKWRQSAVMTDRWRLVNGTELYDILADREQRSDVAADHPDVVERLRREYDGWWDTVSGRFDEYCPIIVGSDRETVSTITGHDWHGETCPWNQGQVRQGVACNGFWVIDVAEAGRYTFELRRWPREDDRAMSDGIPGEIEDWYTGGNALPLKTARIRVGDQEAEGPVEPDARGVTFTLDLAAGEARLETWLSDGADLVLGAYYVYVERVEAT
jgi:arylsulfatase B